MTYPTPPPFSRRGRWSFCVCAVANVILSARIELGRFGEQKKEFPSKKEGERRPLGGVQKAPGVFRFFFIGFASFIRHCDVRKWARPMGSLVARGGYYDLE